MTGGGQLPHVLTKFPYTLTEVLLRGPLQTGQASFIEIGAIACAATDWSYRGCTLKTFNLMLLSILMKGCSFVKFISTHVQDEIIHLC